MGEVVVEEGQEVDYGTAIRAIWMLWRRGKKAQIAEIGLPWKEMSKEFSLFDALFANENLIVRGHSQTKALLIYLGKHNSDLGYKLVSQAVYMIHLYHERKQDEGLSYQD